MPYRPVAAKLDDYLTGIYQSRAKTPAILVKTDYKIEIASGLALVCVTRRFKNEENNAIEAVMTFPVPFNAAVTRLEAEVDGRRLVGVASAKAQARETYETAIDNGKSAVLHEELLPGMHMVSVANVRSKAFIDVTAHFAMPVIAAGEGFKLRIPLTVGQIYGNSPLMNADALVADGPEQTASVVISGDGEDIRLNGSPIAGAEQSVSLGSVIEIAFKQEQLRPISAKAKDGRIVTLNFGRQVSQQDDGEFDLLLDTSGSMRETDASGNVKWKAMIDALSNVQALNFQSGDKINLWTFSSRTRFIGATSKSRLAGDLANVPFEGGSTELQTAIEEVAASRESANILLLTDGKAWHLDFQKAIRNGARITVVLIGSEALEAKVGYLAAMSGGQLFPCFGPDTATMIAEAVRSMRTVSDPVIMTGGRPGQLRRTIGGVTIEANWKASKKSIKDIDGVSQFATFLAIAGMDEDKASVYAAEEGIVTHLTSIALVDEAGEAVEGVPSQRKVPLSAPVAGDRHTLQLLGSSMKSMRSMGFASASLSTDDCGGGAMAASFLAGDSVPLERTRGVSGPKQAPIADRLRGVSGQPVKSIKARRASKLLPDTQESISPYVGGKSPLGDIIPRVTSDAPSNDDLSDLLKHVTSTTVTPPTGWTLQASLKTMPIDWDKHASALSKADLDGLPLTVRARVRAISDNSAVLAVATRLGRSNIELAIGLIAYVDKDRSKTADRIQRRFLKDVDLAEITDLLSKL